MIAMMRAAIGRVGLIGGAIAPFAPAAAEFVRRGVPDYLFTGDGATLELRTLHAAHGAQLLGPYSGFYWNHPGPAFFYLAGFYLRVSPAVMTTELMRSFTITAADLGNFSAVL